MAGVNLLSQSTRFIRERNRRIRRWAIAVVLATALAAIPVTINVVQTARAAQVQQQIQPVTTRVETARKELRRLRTAYDRLELQIERATALRTKRSWGDMLEVLSQQIPEEVWVTGIESYSVETDAPAPVASDEQPEEVVILPGPTAIRIRGYALDYKWIYQWVDDLKQTQLFEGVVSTKTVSEPLFQGEAIQFVLECEW